MRARLAMIVGIAGVALAAAGAFAWSRTDQDAAARRTCPGALLSVAAVGDIMMGADPDPAARTAPQTEPLLRASHVTLGSLAMSLAPKPDQADPRGPVGGARHAQLLRRWGFTVLSRANDHVADFGRRGIEQTGALLRQADLASAGAGADLSAARAPTWLKTSCGPVAVISVATSLRGEDPATPTRPGIAGRPGANPLRHSVRLEVDSAVYRTLAAEAVHLGGAAPDADGRLQLFGSILEPGARTASVITVDARDQAEVLATIRAARKTAVLVLVSLHSHETGADAGEPAPFVEDFARAAVDAGAGLVVGQGPHRLRPLEFRGGGLIAYSLGDFIADRRVAASLAANPFDAAGPAAPQGAVLSARFRGGRIVSARLIPLNLSADGATLAGFPRRAQPGSAAMAEVARASAARGASLAQRGGGIDVTPTPRPAGAA